MPDLLKKNYSLHAAALVGLYWIVVFAIPFIVTDPGVKPGALGWCFLLTLIGYGGYSGIRAFKRGRKAAFILRIVVPAALFVLGWMVIAASSLI